MRQLAGLAAAALLFACPVSACEARFDAAGLPGRAAVAAFANRTAAGRHEPWAPRGARLEMVAAFAEPTDIYGHRVLGPLRDARVLTIHIRQPGDSRITCPAEAELPADEVFEDIAPRLADLDGDGLPEVIVVQSSTRLGARLAVYDRRARLLAATPNIGRPFRWLAPAGAADLDGDGRVEIAYVDRPHLARILRIWRLERGRLTEIASAPGFSNHRIGDAAISGGIRTCADGPEIITANADWTRITAATLRGGTIHSRDLGPLVGNGLKQALICD